MVNKFLIAIAGVVAVMAALVLAPSFSPSDQLEISYVVMHIVRNEAGALEETTSREILAIKNDGSATYTVGSDERRFSLTSEEVKRLRALILETGFMRIPAADYEQKEGLGNFTRYALTVEAGDDSKNFTWVNPEAQGGAIPPIITNIGAQLDAIIERRA